MEKEVTMVIGKRYKISPKQKEYTFDFEMLAEADEKARFEFWFTKQMKL